MDPRHRWPCSVLRVHCSVCQEKSLNLINEKEGDLIVFFLNIKKNIYKYIFCWREYESNLQYDIGRQKGDTALVGLIYGLGQSCYSNVQPQLNNEKRKKRERRSRREKKGGKKRKEIHFPHDTVPALLLEVIPLVHSGVQERRELLHLIPSL